MEQRNHLCWVKGSHLPPQQSWGGGWGGMLNGQTALNSTLSRPSAMNSRTKWQYYGWQKWQISHFWSVYGIITLCFGSSAPSPPACSPACRMSRIAFWLVKRLLIDVRALTPAACVNNLHSSAIKGERGSLNHTGPRWGRTRRRSQKTQTCARRRHTRSFRGNHGVFTLGFFLAFFFF